MTVIEQILTELRGEVEQTSPRGGTRRAGLEAAIRRIEAMKPSLQVKSSGLVKRDTEFVEIEEDPRPQPGTVWRHRDWGGRWTLVAHDPIVKGRVFLSAPNVEAAITTVDRLTTMFVEVT